MELITRGCIPYQKKLKHPGLRIRGKLLCYWVLLVPGPEDVTLLRDGEICQGVWDAQTRGFRVLLGPFGPLSAVTTASEVVAPSVPLLKPLHVQTFFWQLRPCKPP